MQGSTVLSYSSRHRKIPVLFALYTGNNALLWRFVSVLRLVLHCVDVFLLVKTMAR